MRTTHETTRAEFETIPEPRFARWLFASTQAAWLWLAVRLYLGYYWIRFGWDKMFGAESDWLSTGESLQLYLNNQIDPEAPAIYFGWYGDFLGFMADNAAFFAKVIAVGEFLIGVGLVLGAFTGLAAFFGLTLNTNILFAAFGGPSPLFLVLQLGIVLAWRVAGYYGADRYLLPMLGTPTAPGRLFRPDIGEEASESPPLVGGRT